MKLFFPDGVDRNINEHLRRMSMNRTWGREHEIQAARELYSMDIAILDSNQLGKYGGSFTSKTSCKLLFSNGNHYDLLVVNESESDTLENNTTSKNFLLSLTSTLKFLCLEEEARWIQAQPSNG
jgi:hypothetical protein